MCEVQNIEFTSNEDKHDINAILPICITLYPICIYLSVRLSVPSVLSVLISVILILSEQSAK